MCKTCKDLYYGETDHHFHVLLASKKYQKAQSEESVVCDHMLLNQDL